MAEITKRGTQEVVKDGVQLLIETHSLRSKSVPAGFH